ncbi:MAG: hypothetical protein GC158_12640 [Cyanobacteria bacterium RI_101]|nr:hypothetical protein [Cyanobacteria bacterium RI_101]
MIYPSILGRAYQEYFPFLELLSQKVKETLLNYCEKNPNYAFTFRIKTIESVAEKIETGRFKKWTDLDDLFACTIIVPSLTHEPNVIQFCQKTFAIHRTLKRGQNKKAPETFNFDITRIYAKLRSNQDLGVEMGLSVYSIIFEIQIKTAFEHAWTVTTHDLVYKSADIDWQKRRLASQIKANVEQLDSLILAFQSVSELIPKSKSTEIQIKNKLSQEINKLFKNRLIDEELFPKDLSRLIDNLYQLIQALNPNLKPSDIAPVIQKIRGALAIAKPSLSLSLYQYLVGILLLEETNIERLQNHCLHVTDEFKDIYPDVFAQLCQIEILSFFDYEQ